MIVAFVLLFIIPNALIRFLPLMGRGPSLKLLAVSDFHGESNGDSYLEKFLENGYDFLLIIGDFTEMGPASQAEEILTRLGEADIPTLAIPGNCDPKPVKEILEKYGVSLHSKSVRIGGMTFVGLGGSNTTPFNTPFELTEGEIEEELEAQTSKVGGRWVLVTHAPPYGTRADLTSDGVHVGSKSVRRIIEEKQPLAALCAHIHEARSTDKIGRTKVVNPGPITKGCAAEAVFSKGVEINLIEL